MAKSSGNESALSSEAQAAIKDLNSLEGRYGTYVSSIDRGVEVGTFTNDEVVARKHDSCLSVIDGLGAAELRNHLTPEQKEELINSLRETSSAISNTLQDAKEQEKLAINTAKVEAALKGFELPLALGGRSDEIKPHGLNMNEHYPKIIKATQESLVELAGQGIPHEQYAEKLQASILEKVQNQFTPEQLESVEKIVAQGKKLKDSEKPLEKQKFQQSDLQSLKDAATKASNQFQEILNENKKEAGIISIIQKATRNIEEDHNLKTTKARESKILKDLSPSLSKLDPEYLAQYSDVISHELANSLRAQGTYMGRARGELRVSKSNRTRIADNLLKDHLAASEKFALNKVTGELFKKQLSNTQIADRLNEFAKATGTQEVYNTSNIPSDKELVQIRKANQKLFDNIILGNRPEKTVQNVEVPEPKKETVAPKKPEIATPPAFLAESNPLKKNAESQLDAPSPTVKPKPDNELAANEPEKPKISEAKVDATIKALRGDFTGITGFIAGEFVKIATANNGVIDIENPTFAKAADSLINADPKIINSEENVKKRGGNSAVLSFTGTKQGIEEKIDKLIAKGADPDKFTSLREDLSNLETELRTQTSSSEGIKELVGKKMTNELIANNTVLFIHDEKGETQQMPMVQKKDIIAKIAKNVHLDNAAVSTMLSGEQDVQNIIKGTTNRLISETLGKKDKNFYVIDESKLTPENLEKLSKSVENAVSQAPLVSGIIKSIEQESGLEINDARKAKLLKNLSPALGQLDPEYLEQYKDIIATDLAKEIQAQGSRWGRMNGELRTSTKSQEMIANNLLEKHLASSEEFVTKKISGTFYKKQLTNTQMADRLNEFAKASGSEHVFKASNIPSDKDLAQMRKANPKMFDKVVLGDKAKPEIPDDVRKKLAGNMKVENSKKAAVQPAARGKANQSADRGM